jgi:hypothetical protein
LLAQIFELIKMYGKTTIKILWKHLRNILYRLCLKKLIFYSAADNCLNVPQLLFRTYCAVQCIQGPRTWQILIAKICNNFYVACWNNMWSAFVTQYLAASYLTNPEEHNPSWGACSFSNAPVQTGPWSPPSPLYSGYRVIPVWYRGRTVALTIHPI